MPETPITETAVTEAADAAIAAIAAATSVSELRSARAAHVGDASPLARFNASLKTIAAGERAAAGKLVGQARARVTAGARGPRG